ncbi:MAG: YbjN domain-containing protein [Oscillospiraceae bacterium]|nr:YbjN domain-containing protein [Oscillospiraceae bacterium]
MKTMKKLLAVLLVLCLFMSLSLPAFAANAQYGTTKSFLKVMDREKIRYNYMGIDNDDDEEVDVNGVGDYMDKIAIKIFFDSDLDVVSLRSWRVIKFQKADTAKVLEAVNKLNNENKFIKFVVDEEDLSVDAKIDCIVRDDAVAGEIVYDAVTYMVYSVDEAYPELKAFEKK